MVIGLRLLATPSVVGCHARKCEVSVGEIGIGWRGPRSSWKKERVGKERGGASEDGEGSTLAGDSYWQEHLTKGRLSSTLMPSLIC